jgi:hypothetical protein
MGWNPSAMDIAALELPGGYSAKVFSWAGA